MQKSKKKVVKKKSTTKKKSATKKVVSKVTSKRKVGKKLKKPVKQVATTIKIVQGKPLDLAKEKPVGKITHYYGRIKVGVVEIHKGQQIAVGETLYYSGHTTDFHDTLSSIHEYDKTLHVAKGKKQVGIKVKKRVRRGDKVFRITPIK